MKAGTEDSSALVSRYFRPQQEETPGFFSLLLGETSTPSPFAAVTNSTEAKMIFEQLRRQQAIISLHGKAQLITTPTLPLGKLDHSKLTALETAYARHLLTPVKDIGKENTALRLYLVPASPTVKRRTYQPAIKQQKPFAVFTGDLEQDILTAFTHFHYLTLDQLTTLLGKKEGNKNYLRKKLNDMIEDSVLDVTQLPRMTGGKPLQIYFAASSGEKKHLFLEHTLDCNAVLIAGFQLPTIEPSLTLVDLKHERILKAALSSSVIPDGLLSYQTQAGEMISIALEIDRNTENRERIEQKLTGYHLCMKSMNLQTLTIAFLVTTGDAKRVSALRELARETIGESDLASLFLFAHVPVEKLSPSVLLDPVFTGLDTTPHALIEKPF
jgi:hypothetical protein